MLGRTHLNSSRECKSAFPSVRKCKFGRDIESEPTAIQVPTGSFFDSLFERKFGTIAKFLFCLGAVADPLLLFQINHLLAIQSSRFSLQIHHKVAFWVIGRRKSKKTCQLVSSFSFLCQIANPDPLQVVISQQSRQPQHRSRS